MSDFVQLDLFGDRPNIDRPTNAALLQSLLPQELSDEELIVALPEATLADACALAVEAGTRRLSAAIPALVTLCNRFVGYGIDVGVPEQAAALEALGVIGGPEASRAVVQLIVKRIVQGPTLVVATAVASQVGDGKSGGADSFETVFDPKAFGPRGRGRGCGGGRRSHRIACAGRPRSPRLSAFNHFHARRNRQPKGRVRRLGAKGVCV
jgi:hypothetical protein